MVTDEVVKACLAAIGHHRLVIRDAFATARDEEGIRLLLDALGMGTVENSAAKIVVISEVMWVALSRWWSNEDWFKENWHLGKEVRRSCHENIEKDKKTVLDEYGRLYGVAMQNAARKAVR